MLSTNTRECEGNSSAGNMNVSHNVEWDVCASEAVSITQMKESEGSP